MIILITSFPTCQGTTWLSAKTYTLPSRSLPLLPVIHKFLCFIHFYSTLLQSLTIAHHLGLPFLYISKSLVHFFHRCYHIHEKNCHFVNLYFNLDIFPSWWNILPIQLVKMVVFLVTQGPGLVKQMMAHIKEERERKLQKQKELEEEELRRQEEVRLLYTGTVQEAPNMRSSLFHIFNLTLDIFLFLLQYNTRYFMCTFILYPFLYSTLL